MYGFAHRLSNEILRGESTDRAENRRSWNRNGAARPRYPGKRSRVSEIKRISGPDWTFGLSPDTSPGPLGRR